MTVDRHELYDLVEEMPDDQVSPAIAGLRRFFGAGVAKDGRTDIASNIDDYFVEGLGRTRT